MSKVVNGTFFIEHEEPGTCEYCGKVAELRPYGRNGARICFACGMANEEETSANMKMLLAGVDKVVAPALTAEPISVLAALFGDLQ